jgi:hypothetical protein
LRNDGHARLNPDSQQFAEPYFNQVTDHLMPGGGGMQFGA